MMGRKWDRRDKRDEGEKTGGEVQQVAIGRMTARQTDEDGGSDRHKTSGLERTIRAS